MKVRIVEGGFSPFLLFVRAASDSPRGSLTINLCEVQAISRADPRTATVGVLIGGCWVYGQLTDRLWTSFLSEDEYLAHISKKYDELGIAWVDAKKPLFIGDPDG